MRRVLHAGIPFLIAFLVISKFSTDWKGIRQTCKKTDYLR